MANIQALDTPDSLVLSDLERKIIEGLASRKNAKTLSVELGIPVLAINTLVRRPGVSEFLQEIIDARNMMMKMSLPDLLMAVLEDKVAKNAEDEDGRLADLTRKDVVDIAKELNAMLKTSGSETKDEGEDKFVKIYQQINLLQGTTSMYSRKDKGNQKYSNKDIELFLHEYYNSYTILDIIQDGELRVELKCSEGYRYIVAYRKLLAGKTPRFTTTKHNIIQVCRNHSVTYIQDINSPSLGNKYRIMYSYNGRVFDKLFYSLKEVGHTERLSLATLKAEKGVELIGTYLEGSTRFVEGICGIHGEFSTSWVSGASSYCNKCRRVTMLKAMRHYTFEDIAEHAQHLGIEDFTVSNNKVTYTCEIGHPAIILLVPAFMKKQSAKCIRCTQHRGMVYLPNTIYKYEDTPGIIYILRLTSESETFYKVGISTDFKRRLRNLGETYSIEVMYMHETNMAEAYRVEQLTLRQYKDHTYKPLVRFTGHTECLIASPAELGWFIRKEINA